jgi:hypothetical protein
MTTDGPRACVDGGPGNADVLPRPGPAGPARRPRWTDAHAEAARFLGECIGAGAVLGTIVAMGRVRWEDGYARRAG